ncbi:MAG: O-antigen ligase family protein [Oscillospiraceae bacterium]|nr:O-antigen ligase family protein [Oscillospiraceae bacterium]
MDSNRRIKLTISKKGLQKDLILIRFVCAYLVMNAINSMVQVTFGVSGSLFTIIRWSIYLILFVMIALGVLTFTKTEIRRFFLLEALVTIVYILSFLINGSNDALKWLIDSIGIYIPLAFFSMTVEDKELFYRSFLKTSWVLLVISLIYSVGITGYNMHFSYTILLIILLHLNEAMNGKKWYYIPTAVEIILLLRLGSRGAIVSIVVFVVIKILANGTGKKKYIQAALVAIFAGLVFWVIDRYGIQIYRSIANAGRQSRSLYLLFSGQIFSHDSGRIALWEMSIRAIQEKPVLGWGINGALSELSGHPYPHQLFLDLMLTFGIPIGLILSCIVLVSAIRSLFKPASVQKELMSIFFCIGFVSLMFSGTIFTNYYFFIFLGLIKVFREDERKQLIEDRV